MSYGNLKMTLPILFKLYTVIGCVVLKVCIVFGEILILDFFTKNQKKGGDFIRRTVTIKPLQ